MAVQDAGLRDSGYAGAGTVNGGCEEITGEITHRPEGTRL